MVVRQAVGHMTQAASVCFIFFNCFLYEHLQNAEFLFLTCKLSLLQQAHACTSPTRLFMTLSWPSLKRCSRKVRKGRCRSRERRKKRRKAGVQQSISGCTSRLRRLIFLKASSWVSARSAGGRCDRPAPAHASQLDVPSVNKVTAAGSEGCSTVQGSRILSRAAPARPGQIYCRLLRRDKWRRGNTCCPPSVCRGSGCSSCCGRWFTVTSVSFLTPFSLGRNMVP